MEIPQEMLNTDITITMLFTLVQLVQNPKVDICIVAKFVWSSLTVGILDHPIDKLSYCSPLIFLISQCQVVIENSTQMSAFQTNGLVQTHHLSMLIKLTWHQPHEGGF